MMNRPLPDPVISVQDDRQPRSALCRAIESELMKLFRHGFFTFKAICSCNRDAASVCQHTHGFFRVLTIECLIVPSVQLY